MNGDARADVWWLSRKAPEIERGIKRLPSLAVELFFAKNILPILRIRGRENLHAKTGWFRFSSLDRSNYTEQYWGYLAPGKPDPETL